MPGAKAQRVPSSLRAQIQPSSAEGCLRLPSQCVCAGSGRSRIRPATNAICRRQTPAASGLDRNPSLPMSGGRKEQGSGLTALGSCLLSVRRRREGRAVICLVCVFNIITHGPVGRCCLAGAAQLQVRRSGGVKQHVLPRWLSVPIESMAATCLL